MREELFSFVVLNYESTEETIQCVRSIEKLTYANKHIVIVDNCSSNSEQFFETAKKELKEWNNITYLSTTFNNGYARGNNVGIYYAKHVLESDYVCVINPDTEIINADFIEVAIEHYQKYGYAVCGPRIILDDKSVNPGVGYDESLKYNLRNLLFDIKLITVKKLNLSRFRFWKKKASVNASVDIKSKGSSVKDDSTRELRKETKEFLLGACLIFSPLFIENYEGFGNKTFLYCEEAILQCACYGLGLKLFYCNDLLIVHEGGKSMENTVEDSVERLVRIHTIGAKSCWEAIKVFVRHNSKKAMQSVLRGKVDKYYVK